MKATIIAKCIMALSLISASAAFALTCPGNNDFTYNAKTASYTAPDGWCWLDQGDSVCDKVLKKNPVFVGAFYAKWFVGPELKNSAICYYGLHDRYILYSMLKLLTPPAVTGLWRDDYLFGRSCVSTTPAACPF